VIVRALGLVVALCAACGGPPAPHGPAVGARAVDAGVAAKDDSPEDAAVDPCDAYARQVAPALGRISRAADGAIGDLDGSHGGAAVARAATSLADAVEAERPGLESIRTGVHALDAVHARLVDALGDLARALRDYGAAAERGDPAGKNAAAGQLNVAMHTWDDAVAELARECPDLS
jgi:hypothetical protein